MKRNLNINKMENEWNGKKFNEILRSSFKICKPKLKTFYRQFHMQRKIKRDNKYLCEDKKRTKAIDKK